MQQEIVALDVKLLEPVWRTAIVLRKPKLKSKDVASSSAPAARTANTGDNDASLDNTPSQFLLLRGLEPSVTEELLAKGVAKMYKPYGGTTHSRQFSGKKGAKVASTTGDSNIGAKEGSLRRILLVRDRNTDESWRFGFAEFASVEDAQAALTRYNSFDKFTIASKPVLASYIHAGVFVPILNPSTANSRFTFSPFGNPAMKLGYWDDEAYVTELVMSSACSVENAEKTKSENTFAPAETEGFKAIKDSDKSKKRKAEVATTAQSAAKKSAPSHLQFWSDRHAELHGLEKKPAEDNSDNPEMSGIRSKSSDGNTAPLAQSYADPNRKCCYLCSRQFKSTAEVNRHERLSALHQQNLKNEDLVSRAKHKLEKHDVKPQQATAEYRDRAKERRKAFGVVNKKGQQVLGAGSRQANKTATSNDDDDSEETLAVPSKGASLLGKMGYTLGSGLGASGSGITAAISQDVYVAGVGLGAQGGKVGDAVVEAERNTKGEYGGFAERTREGARERFGRL